MKRIVLLLVLTAVSVGVARPRSWRAEVDQLVKQAEAVNQHIMEVASAIHALTEEIDPNKPSPIAGLDLPQVDTEWPSGMTAPDWIELLDAQIKVTENFYLELKRAAYLQIHLAKQADVEIPALTRRIIPSSQSRINENWEDNFAIGSVAYVSSDRRSVQLFQRKTSTKALLRVYRRAITRRTDTYRGDLILFRNYDFRDIPDESSINPRRLFIITGTETYGTAIGGQNTVYVAEPF